MNQWLIFLLCFLEVFSTSTPPLLSKLGDSFRSGDAKVDIIGTQSTYDFNVPYSFSLPSNQVALALSMYNYKQAMPSNMGIQISYSLLEDVPSPSNSTYAVFRVVLGYPTLTSIANIRYLVCPISILSLNFNIIVCEFSQIILDGKHSKMYTISTPLNTTYGTYSTAIWMSTLNVQCSSGGQSVDQLYLDIWFSQNLIVVSNIGEQALSLKRVRCTLIFMNDAVTSIQLQKYRLPYSLYFFQPGYLNSSQSWFDAHNIICGIYSMGFTNQNLFWFNTSVSWNRINSKDNLFQSWKHCLIAGQMMCPEDHPYYNTNNNLCFDECTGQNLYSYLCCPQNCDNCSVSDVCDFCSSLYYLRSDGQCYQDCLNGTFPHYSTRTCDKCPTGCETCISQTACQTCLSPYYLRDDRLCYKDCPQDYYPEDKNRTCIQCPKGCATCTSLTTCQTCSSSYFMRNDNLCYQDCSPGYYPQKSNQTCTLCPIRCATCTSLTSCQTCLSSFFLRNDSLCYKDCLPGSYPQKSNFTCPLCPKGCAICTSLSSCQTCQQSYFLIPGGLCYSNCPSGYYPETTNFTCIGCPVNCATCTSQTVCLTCRLPYELVNSMCTYSEPSNMGLIIGLVGAGVVVIVLVVIVVWCKKRQRRLAPRKSDILSDATVAMLSGE